MKKAIIISLIVIGMLGLGFFLFQLDAKNSKFAVKNDGSKLPQVGQEFPNLGQKHIGVGESHEPYNSNPPTSGPHYAQPADWGVYDKELPDEQLVHNLEHGGIWISYKDMDGDTKTKIQAIATANPGKVIVTQRGKDDAKIVLASWTRLEKMESFDEAKILEFIKANVNKSPEPLAM